MNHREAPPGTAKGSWAWLFMSLMLPAVASKMNMPPPLFGSAEGSLPLVPHEPSDPYLLYVPPPPLRFEDPAPPPDLSAHPAAGAPPKPTAAGLLARDDRRSAPAVRPAVSASVSSSSSSAPSKGPDVILPKPPATPSILADDVPPAVKPEDFLPYFQFPGAPAGGSAVDHPAPLSTATYTQSQ
jgi:hypothetical protein